MTQSLAELEQLCNVLYNSHNPNERAHAEGVLRPFSTNPEYIPQCKVRTPSRMRWFFFARAHPFNNTRLTVGRRAGEADGTAACVELLARSSTHARGGPDPGRRRESVSASSPPGSGRARASNPRAAARLESANEAHKLFFLTRLLKTLPSVDENPPPSCRSLRL